MKNRLRFEAGAIELTLRSIACAIGLVTVLLAPLALSWFLRWLLARLRFDDGTQARYEGGARKCALAALYPLSMFLTWYGRDKMNVAAAGPAFGFLVSAGSTVVYGLILWFLYRDILSGTVTSHGSRLRFRAPLSLFLCWCLGSAAIGEVVDALMPQGKTPDVIDAAVTVVLGLVGFTAMMVYSFLFERWRLRQIVGGHRRMRMDVDLFGFVWRPVALILGGVAIIPFPWLLRWLTEWAYSLVSLEGEVE